MCSVKDIPPSHTHIMCNVSKAPHVSKAENLAVHFGRLKCEFQQGLRHTAKRTPTKYVPSIKCTLDKCEKTYTRILEMSKCDNVLHIMAAKYYSLKKLRVDEDHLYHKNRFKCFHNKM